MIFAEKTGLRKKSFSDQPDSLEDACKCLGILFSHIGEFFISACADICLQI